jgi:TatD DNase family protein
VTDKPLWDTHAHLTEKRLAPDWKLILDEALAAGVHGVINIGVDVETSQAAVNQAEQVPDRLRATVGLLPHEASRLTPEMVVEIEQLAGADLVIAVGEIGLDYHYTLSNEVDQRQAFCMQMGIAGEFGLPIVVHSRDAEKDVAHLIEEMEDSLVGGVLHCYTGGIIEARKMLNLGFHISFTGIVTFSNGELNDLVRFVPLDRLLLETDSPYLAPIPYRGKINRPAYLPVIATRIAELKGIEVDELIAIASENADKLFGLSQTRPRANRDPE